MIRKQAGLLGWNGVLARLLITAVTIGVLATARPSEPWAWPVLVAALLSFLAGTFLMHRSELWALGLQRPQPPRPVRPHRRLPQLVVDYAYRHGIAEA